MRPAPRPVPPPPAPKRFASLDEAEGVIAHLETTMDSLLSTIEQETALVRAGRLREATLLETGKADLARAYTADCQRIKDSKDYLVEHLPAALSALRDRHDIFHALLQINLTVLATAHAVSEGIIRGVSGELSRRTSPSTYGAGGRVNKPGPRGTQPLALSRTL